MDESFTNETIPVHFREKSRKSECSRVNNAEKHDILFERIMRQRYLPLVLAIFGCQTHAEVPATALGVASGSRVAAAMLSKPVCDVMFLLDLSGSMTKRTEKVGPVIVQMVNNLIRTQRFSVVKVGFIGYGERESFLVSKPTSDLEEMNQNFKNYRIHKWSTEHVATVLKKASEGAFWTRLSSRNIVIVGNESPVQAPYNLPDAIVQARKKAINISALYCGGEYDHAKKKEIKRDWLRMAQLGCGDFYDLETNQWIDPSRISLDAPVVQTGARPLMPGRKPGNGG